MSQKSAIIFIQPEKSQESIKMTNKIKSRESYLVVQDLDNEMLIYDLKINKAFCLTESAAMVWRLCDGAKTVAEISQIMSEQLNTTVSEDFVWLAIEELKNANLLANPEAVQSKFDGHSRREIIMKVGLATMVTLPFIISVVAPTAAHAQSDACIPSGQQFCLSPQNDFRTCINELNAAAVNECCVGTLFDFSFGTPQDPNACCGICGIPAP